MSMWLLWLIIAAVLTTVAFLRVGVYVVYRNDLDLKLQVGGVRLAFSGKERKSEKKTVTSGAGGKAKSGRTLKLWLQAAIERRAEILELIARVLSAPTLDVLRIHVWVGGKEPDQCALNYGRICALVGSLLGPVESIYMIKKKSVDVRCEFDRTDIEFDLEIATTLRVYEIAALAFAGLKLGFGLYRQVKSNVKVV